MIIDTFSIKLKIFQQLFLPVKKSSQFVSEFERDSFKLRIDLLVFQSEI